jgi:ribosomal protein S18 acetylase RimI-like enzyme
MTSLQRERKTVTIRIATPYELSIIKSYAPKIREEASMGYLKEDVYGSEDLYSFDNSFYIVSVEAGNLQGWSMVGETFDPFLDHFTGVIVELYVFKSERNKGIGKKLVTTSINHFKNRGITKVHLNVFAGNPAKNLYEKLGFKEVSTLMEKKI